MWQSPTSGIPENMEYPEAVDALKAVNESLKDNGWDSTSFLVKWEDGDIEFEEGDF